MAQQTRSVATKYPTGRLNRNIAQFAQVKSFDPYFQESSEIVYITRLFFFPPIWFCLGVKQSACSTDTCIYCCLLGLTARKIRYDLCRTLLKLHLKQDLKLILSRSELQRFFCLAMMVLLVKFGGAKLPTWFQFCNQHELEMDNDLLSLLLNFPFPSDR